MKRNFFSILIFIFCFVHAFAQNKLTSYEYWFDAAYSSKITTLISPASNFSLNTNIPTGALKQGIHTFHIRFKDDSLNYSCVQESYFFYSTPLISAYEYWIDNNFANRTIQTVSPSQIVDLTAAISTNTSSVGIHTLHLRFRTSNGQYSNVVSSYFISSNSKIQAYEYWTDNNFANLTIQAVSPSQIVDLTAAIATNTSGVGIHTLHLRFKSSNGQYSSVVSSYFIRSSSTMEAYEYWFDNKYSNKISQTTTPGQNVQLLQGIDVSSIESGYHIFTIRFRDSAQNWSSSQSSFFVKLGQDPNGNMISAYRYWFDSADTTLVTLAVPSPAKVVHLTTAIPTTQLSGTTHKVTIQVKDTSGVWSGVISQNFVLCSASGPIGAAGQISGQTFVSACQNQNGIVYSIDTISNATNYNWLLPPQASIVGIADTTSITVNYSPYSSSGSISVSGSNACGAGTPANLAVNFKAIPVAEICKGSIDSATQKTILKWQKPIETYVDGYVIFRLVAGTFVAIDTIPTTQFSSYLDTGSHPELKAEKYKIAVLDSCGNTGDTSAVFEHQTIRLYGSVQPGGVAKLYWNDYVGINDPSRYFKLIRDTLGTGPFNDTLASNISPAPYMNSSDPQSASYPLARYVVEMVYNSNCTPGFRTLLNKSTSRSNIKNKTALFDSTSVGIINELKNVQLFSVYPNPAQNELTVQCFTDFGTLYIKDIFGRTISTKEIAGENSTPSIVKFDLSSIDGGIYFIHLESKLGNKMEKLILLKN
jgi:PKD-like domain/Secretion system C-terminal sorting domain